MRSGDSLRRKSRLPRESYFLAFPNHSLSTREEAEAIVPELAAWGSTRVLLVTSDFHTHRAGGIYRALAPDLRCVVVAAPDRIFHAWRLVAES